MSDDDQKRRTVRVNVRLNPEMMAKLEVIAQDLGVPASTVSAVAIGEYVNKKFLEKHMFANAASASTSVIESMGDRVMQALQDPEIAARMVASLEGAGMRLEED